VRLFRFSKSELSGPADLKRPLGIDGAAKLADRPNNATANDEPDLWAQSGGKHRLAK
jgi:hypothetical protein